MKYVDESVMTKDVILASIASRTQTLWSENSDKYEELFEQYEVVKWLMKIQHKNII